MIDKNAAMKADYLRVLAENKKLKQENANLQKEIHVMKSIIPKDEIESWPTGLGDKKDE
jgi:hypothetical protein|tara:strand:- start:4408 stop:4584 length:177 start_codon:yes stop_codon:yes gene_type:complete